MTHPIVITVRNFNNDPYATFSFSVMTPQDAITALENYFNIDNKKGPKMKETVLSIAKWHQETFPDATMEDQLRKFDEEMEEYDRTPTFEELADMFIVACGLCRFDMVVAMSYMTIVATALNERKEIYASTVFPNKVDEKMAKNRKRTWEKTQYGNYHHTNTED